MVIFQEKETKDKKKTMQGVFKKQTGQHFLSYVSFMVNAI